ncbi:metallophosphoesterase family protein [Gimesia sp.]|uniref:metallophosphoesterase family protein n=1 Tax=Gimesia sp. TaxID=2024833 RepID=UPI000C5078B4|nr:metallophosphoesterase family protein [Gimesia sp.]MAX36619.1 metallophosphoesterase [Gimesia sp.]|tara:strand:+ start:54 stop:1421 length:1368 start_codon:yes stop_codon:yes gene_type:complete
MSHCFCILSVLFSLLLVPFSAPQEIYAGEADRQIYQPTPVPDRIMLTWKQDPAHAQSVTWRTDTSVNECFGEIAFAGEGPEFVKRSRQLKAETSELKTDRGDCHFHALTFTDLKPDTLYAYRVGAGENWSEWLQFRTLSDKAAPITFIYFGDAQNQIKSLWSRVIRQAVLTAPQARFLLHAGDLVNRGNKDEEWGEWNNSGGWLNGMLPNLAIPGNHEYDINRVNPTAEEQKTEKRHLARRWRQRFEFPENGPSGMKETVYYLDFQGIRLIGLNSMDDIETQARWLETVLKDNPNRWTIVTHHHPINSVSEGRDNPELRKHWQPLYDQYQVDLVLQGHDHSYGRTGLVLQRNSGQNTGQKARRQSAGGTVYAVSVSGPKMYELKAENDFLRRAAETQLYQVITVEPQEIRYQAFTATGTLYDAFTLRKNSRQGGPNELINQIPDTPDRVGSAEKD